MSRPLNGYPRNGPNTSASSTSRLVTPQPPHNPHPPPPDLSMNSMSRAERFEDEKRRIIESCFSQLDQNGQLVESYITHIRIIEDGQYASAPPPPDSAESNKKPRLIIIAVRSTGRVRMHKARENANGSFSIGKTWNMEEISAIESYSHSSAPPQSEKEALYRNWAGDTGFAVTMSKAYYWQAGTSKEKDFFIASAVKIYRKYTKGQVPELRGFDDREKALILGGIPNQTAPPPSQPRQPTQSPIPAPPQPPFGQREQSREESRYRQSPGPPPSVSDMRIGSGPNSRAPSESPARFATPQGGTGFMPPASRPSANTDQMRGQSKDGRGPEHRPGASPAPGFRSPSYAASQRSAAQPPTSPSRTGSPAFAPPTQVPAPLRPHTPPARQRDVQPHIDGSSDERPPGQAPYANGASNSSGANLFQQARQRYMNYQPGPTSTLPPIETENAQLSSHGSSNPLTAHSDSSAGIDPGDAAAIGALASYWGPDHATATPSPVVPQEHPSPATPERSKHRPQLGSKASLSSVDLRPAPLNQSRNVSQATTVEREPSDEAVSPLEEPVQVKPLQVQNKSEPQSQASRTLTLASMRPLADSSPSETPVDEKSEAELYRPGLGPMIKKQGVAERFKRAANAASAFKPRPGGAAEKILQAKAERAGEPDGITGVVPRPNFRERLKSEEPPALQTTPASPDKDLAVKEPEQEKPPAVEVSPISPESPARLETPPAAEINRSVELVDENPAHLQPPTSEPTTVEEEQLEQRQIRQPNVKIRRRDAQQEKYLASLGIDRSLLEGKGLEFDEMLSEFGWSNQVLQPKLLAALENDIRREQGRVEAGSWLSHTDAAREERVAHVDGLLDQAIAECDELEGLLTLYNVELSSLNEDIAFIEAQSQGLQVQSANQKLLQTELQGLVNTMSLDRRVLEPIRRADLSNPRELEEVEGCLVKLYQALVMMDPSLPSRQRSRAGFSDSEASNMAAMRDKKIAYSDELSSFSKRLMLFLDNKFTVSMNAAKGRAVRAPGSGSLAKLNATAFSDVRKELWMYSPLILFTKDLNVPAWQKLLQMYNMRAGILYNDAFKENITNWKRAARPNAGDEADILFTTQEKEDPAGGGLTSTARKLTVKRSQTLAKTLQRAEKHHAPEPRQPGAMMRAQAFAGALDEMAPLMSREQNFFVDLFHAHSLDAEDFIESVQVAAPSSRHVTNLLHRKPTDPDRNMAGLVSTAMSEIFGFFSREVDTMMHWSISDDPVQGVGVMASLSRHQFYLQEGSQEYLLQLVRELSDKLQTRFTRFVEDQIRAIEDTKVKIKKRKGVIAFMKIFPHFSAAVENIFASVAGNDYDGPADCVLDVRKLVDDAYDRINHAMFDSLKVIAKESPVAGVPSARQAPVGDDPEDKEMLNYHILLIENMNHYVEEVDDGGKQGVLAEWRGRAQMERAEALEAYVARVIRRPLGKLLDFLESAESILSTSHNPSSVSSRPSYSRKAMRTVLSQHDNKEVRRGLETLRKRIEKHFGDADEEAISRSLVSYVCKECERAYERVLERTEKLVKEVYPPTEGEKTVEIDFSRADVQAVFRR